MSEMTLVLLFFELALATVLLCFSNGAPPGKKIPYSHQEEDFVIKKLASLGSLYNRNMWKVIATAHAIKVKAKAPGFLKERSAKALRSHFSDTTKKKNVKVPRTMRLLRNEKTNKPYSKEENEFINTFLKTHEGNMHGDIKWTEMEQKHDEKREAGLSGFSNKRTPDGLRSHFRKYMIPKGLVHEDIKKRFSDYFKSKEGSTITEGSKQGDWFRYSSQEIQFIIKMLDDHASTYNLNTWKIIEQAHKNKVEAGDSGFFTPRSAHALYQSFLTLMKRNDIEVPDTVKNLYGEQTNTYYTANEREFINTELLSCEGHLYSKKTWKEIEKRHDQKRKSGCPGFIHRRTWNGLRTYFQKRMVAEDLVHEAVKRMFPLNFEKERGSTSTGEEEQDDPAANQNAESARDNEDEVMVGAGYYEDDVWDTTLEDLNQLQRSPVDEFGVDHTLFGDQRAVRDNYLFDLNPPYKVRTFEQMSPEQLPYL